MPVKVLVVDDSAFMRRIISDILQSDPMIRVVATAKNGRDALEAISRYRPDVITLDIEMPIMGGLEILPEIVKRYKIPVIIISSLTTQGADATIRALEMGAFDFIVKPTINHFFDLRQCSEEIIGKVKSASRQVHTWRPLTPPYYEKKQGDSILRGTGNGIATKEHQVSEIIAIGTSTGGPRALQMVLAQLPQDFSASIVVVQHMPAGFTRTLAKRLNEICKIQVKEGENGEPLRNGYVYIAPGDFHMRIFNTSGEYMISLNQDPPFGGHRPSVDVLFYSLAELPIPRLCGVLLTGMGKDGVEGLAAIKASGGSTIVEAEESCVVYGMPKTAIAKGCVDHVFPLDKISQHLIHWVENK